jgi:hypothetical protein
MARVLSYREPWQRARSQGRRHHRLARDRQRIQTRPGHHAARPRLCPPRPPPLRCSCPPSWQLFAEGLIAATGANPALAGPACDYIRVRAVAQPAVLATMVLQVRLGWGSRSAARERGGAPAAGAVAPVRWHSRSHGRRCWGRCFCGWPRRKKSAAADADGWAARRAQATASGSRQSAAVHGHGSCCPDQQSRLRGRARPLDTPPPPPQAALLAQQDSLTPAVTTAVAVTVSLLGNLLAVGLLGMGIIGAAGSTVATQLVGVVVLAWFSATKPGRLRPSLIVPKWGEWGAMARAAAGAGTWALRLGRDQGGGQQAGAGIHCVRCTCLRQSPPYPGPLHPHHTSRSAELGPMQASRPSVELGTMQTSGHLTAFSLAPPSARPPPQPTCWNLRGRWGRSRSRTSARMCAISFCRPRRPASTPCGWRRTRCVRASTPRRAPGLIRAGRGLVQKACSECLNETTGGCERVWEAPWETLLEFEPGQVCPEPCTPLCGAAALL